jgi:toxin ParE1/3/4
VSFRVSRAAAADLLNILEQGIQRFGPGQAVDYIDGFERAFVQLAEFPMSGPERVDLDMSQRMRAFDAHIIFYAVEPDSCVLITRIRHGLEDSNPNG